VPRIYLLLATLGWGFSFPIVKILRSQFYSEPGVSLLEQSSAFVFLRFGVSAVLFLLIWFLATHNNYKSQNKSFKKILFSKEEILLGLKLGILGGLGLLFQTDGMAYTEAGTSAFLTQMTCVAVPFLALLSGKKKMTWLLFWALACGLGGVYLLSGFEPKTFSLGRGEAETLLCACFFTAQIILLENSSASKDLNNLSLTFWMFLFFALVNLPFINLTHFSLPLLAPKESFLLFALLIFVSSLFPFYVMTKWQPKVSGTEATFIYSLESVFALILSAILLPFLLNAGFEAQAEKMDLSFRVGAVLLIAANFLLYGESIVVGVKSIRSKARKRMTR
jgi:drug/metabolite transporter (DMT)-like permease